MYYVLDLHFQGVPGAIATFLIPSEEGLILIESGPYSTYPNLSQALSDRGYAIEDVRHVLLTHIHFDHAGAAWALARQGATIYVHPFGEKHLINPAALIESATRIYQDQMDVLWGKMDVIESKKVRIVDDWEPLEIGEHTFTALHTPGHAKHHIAWSWEDIIFSGDVGGVKIVDGPVQAPCPPPDIDIDAWHDSITKILNQNPRKLLITHFGEIDDPVEHMQELKSNLKICSEWIFERRERGMSVEEMTQQFQEYANQALEGLSDLHKKQYDLANPVWMSVVGLLRYWKKKII